MRLLCKESNQSILVVPAPYQNTYKGPWLMDSFLGHVIHRTYIVVPSGDHLVSTLRESLNTKHKIHLLRKGYKTVN